MDILSAFVKTFETTLGDPHLNERIQRVKDALYRRSYLEAFGSNENLEAYAVRWSPSRALAYHSILKSKPSTEKLLLSNAQRAALCIGGGAGAEVTALSQFRTSISKIVTIDNGDWAQITKPLAANLGFANVEMLTGDAMSIVPTLDVSQFSLITCLFTTNELVAQSKKGFIKLFKSFARCSPETLLVVIESAGSYSEVQIGSKTFPVHYLLHYTLTHPSPLWDLVESADSEWYRLPEGLKYPLELQNMRYFLRIYCRNYKQHIHRTSAIH